VGAGDLNEPRFARYHTSWSADMHSRILIPAALVLLSILGFFGWRLVQQREHQECAACHRPVHGHSRTVAAVNGQKAEYCCLACALSEHRQTGAAVQVISLTDYARRSDVAPHGAWVVRGSSVGSCAHQAAAVGIDKHPLHAQFDRCAPSLLAFASRREAEGFAKEYGGHAVPYSTVAALLQQSPR
jgi:hypothetical protein